MSIKITRALRKSGFAAYPMTAAAIAGAVPANVIAALSSAQLADLYKAMHRHWRAAIAHAEMAAVDEGAVWDKLSGRLRDLA